MIAGASAYGHCQEMLPKDPGIGHPPYLRTTLYAGPDREFSPV